MQRGQSLDTLVKVRLMQWPQRPPGVRASKLDAWLRGRPVADRVVGGQPFLKLPGSNRCRTLPDGLWLNFGGTPEDPYVDIFAIEACGTLQNLLDKRSRFAPSTHSLLAVCPVHWLLAPVAENDRRRAGRPPACCATSRWPASSCRCATCTSCTG